MSVFTDADSSQGTKAAVHGALLTLAAACAVYNAITCVKRPAPHLACNVVVYGGLVLYEVLQVTHHCR